MIFLILKWLILTASKGEKSLTFFQNCKIGLSDCVCWELTGDGSAVKWDACWGLDGIKLGYTFVTSNPLDHNWHWYKGAEHVTSAEVNIPLT